MSYHLIDIVQQLGTPRILVLGDLILDRYIWGNAERISQEAPVILLQEEKQEERLGGAANVANMLRGLECRVTMAGAVGTDADGRRLQQSLQSRGVDCAAVIEDAGRPTTVKVRFIGQTHHRHPHQMLRVDRESRAGLEPAAQRELHDRIESILADHDCVLISDYAKGVCTPDLLAAVIADCRRHEIPVIVDPGSGVDYSRYRGATAVTPNRLETKLATRRPIVSIDDAFAAGRILCGLLDLSHAFITLDSDGIALVTADGTAEHFPTRKREVYDITGAGDMVLAMIGAGAAEGIAPPDLARLANVAGGLEVEQIGVVAISRQEILADLLHSGRGGHEKVCTLDEVARHVAARRQLGQRIVLTNGCFDLLHVGHVGYLQQAAREGDCLIVATNSDASIRRLNKGDDRPLFPQEQRARMLAALEAVDYVVIFDEETPHALLERLKPDLLVKGGTYTHREIVGWELVEGYGGQVKALGVTPGVSTTEILCKLRGEGTSPPATGGEPTIPFTATERKAG